MVWWFSFWVVGGLRFPVSAGIPRSLHIAPPYVFDEGGGSPTRPYHPWVPAFAGMTRVGGVRFRVFGLGLRCGLGMGCCRRLVRRRILRRRCRGSGGRGLCFRIGRRR